MVRKPSAAPSAGSIHRRMVLSHLALGALAFVASDAVLAANKFRGPLPAAGPFVWTSYCTAQGLLAFGVVVG